MWAFRGRLGTPGADLGAKMDPKRDPEISKNVFKNGARKSPKIDQKMVPKSYWVQRVFGVLFEVFFGLLAKRAQDGAHMAQEGSKMVPERPKTGLR